MNSEALGKEKEAVTKFLDEKVGPQLTKIDNDLDAVTGTTEKDEIARKFLEHKEATLKEIQKNYKGYGDILDQLETVDKKKNKKGFEQLKEQLTKLGSENENLAKKLKMTPKQVMQEAIKKIEAVIETQGKDSATAKQELKILKDAYQKIGEFKLEGEYAKEMKAFETETLAKLKNPKTALIVAGLVLGAAALTSIYMFFFANREVA